MWAIWTLPQNKTNRTMNPLAITREGRRMGKGDGRDDLANVQCKVIRNCHSDSPHTMNIKMGTKK